MRQETDVSCTENLAFPSVKLSSKAGQQLEKVYTFRYWVIRSLTCYITFLPHWLTGGKSLLEIIFMELAFILLIMIIQGYDSHSSGELVADIGCLMILFALRNNVLTLIFGISFERALQWHRAAARLTIILAFMHAIINFKLDSSIVVGDNKSTGIPMLILLITSSLSYYIKNKSFELSYYFHVISYVMVVILGFIHGATVFSLSVIIWGFDISVRYYFAVNKVEAEIISLPGDIICVKFKKFFDYSPGQYCFISVPQISYYQFHPFSISSSPHEELMTLHIRALGDWTTRLQELDSKNLGGAKNDLEVGNIGNIKGDEENEGEGGVHSNQMEGRKDCDKQDTFDTIKRSIWLTVEGPYGLPSVDLGGYYKVYIFIAGGIGITPVQSIHNHLVHKHSTDPSYLAKSFVIWSLKNKRIISNFEKSLNITPKEIFESKPEGSSNGVLNSSDLKKHQNIENETISKNIEMQYNSMLEKTLQNCDDNDGDNNDSNYHVNDIDSPNPFHYDFYITEKNGSTQNNVQNKIGNDSKKRSYSLHNGRPFYLDIFKKISSYCVNLNISRVAVITCGPSTMVDEVQSLCMRRYNGIAFDYHKEVFDL